MISESVENLECTITITGRVDETTQFPKLDFTSFDKIVLVLRGMTSINSLGIRKWLIWLNSIPSIKKVVYRECPSFLIEQIQVFIGFLPPNVYIESFFVPYFCEKCNWITRLLIQNISTLTTPDELNIPDSYQCEKCFNSVEIDVDKTSYVSGLISS